MVLTPYIPLPAKGYKETASTKKLLANLFIQKMGYSMSMFICVLLAEGVLMQELHTVSDPINILHSLKHKESSSRKLIQICNPTFPFNDQLPILMTACSENDSKKLGKKYSDSKLKSLIESDCYKFHPC